MSDARTMLTSGRHNRVVCDHPGMCHHCGFIMGDVVACQGCGVRAHPSCVAFVNGTCDSCRFSLSSEVCAICECEEPETCCDTQRLIKCFVCHGFEWSASDDDDDVPDSHLRLDRDHAISHALTQNPNAHILPDHLPHCGALPMSVVLQDGTRMVSKPLVVHSWCAHCSFQQSIPPERPMVLPNSWRCVMDNLCTPLTHDFAVAFTTEKIATASQNPCVFCERSAGFKVFCFSHTNATCANGCSTCHWAFRPHLSYRCFHPSCAVRAGMRRVTLPGMEGTGMMCDPSSLSFIKQRNPVRERRSFFFESTLFWMEACSGIHVPLLMSLDMTGDPGVCYNSIRMGSLHSSPPLDRAPVFRRRRRAKRARATTIHTVLSEETPQEESNAHHEQERQDHQDRNQRGHSDETQNASHSHGASEQIRLEMGRVRAELMTKQEEFNRRIFNYVTSEVDRLRSEMRHDPSTIHDPDAELLRIKNEIWRCGEREMIAFTMTMDHMRNNP